MATLLSITNRVLKRLREDSVTDLTDTYPNLVAEFVSDIADEVNRSGPGWSALDAEVSLSVIASTRTYDLNSSDGLTRHSTLLFDNNGCALAWYEDASDSTASRPIQYIDREDYERLYQQDRDLTATEPSYFTLISNSDGSGPTLALWPIPSDNRTLRIRFNTPEALLDPDSDASTSILVPEQVVYLGALWLALNERGEEIGEPGGVAEKRYYTALGDAIEDEIRVRERAGRFDWNRN